MDRDQDILDYLQDRLTPDRKAAFENEMAQDASLAAEVDLLRSVQANLAQSPKHENADLVWDRLSAEFAAAPVAANVNRPLWKEALKYAAVAVLSVTTWQVTVGPRIASDQDGFRAASEDEIDASIQVKFVETASYSEIAAVLAQLDARITDGPSALGLVRLSFADANAQQQAISVLEANTALVEIVAD